MPIRFRCTYCNRLLGIATRKAGTETTCPHCGYAITVPNPTEVDDAKTERVNLDDVEEILGNLATERVVEPATQIVQAPPGGAEAPRAEPPKPAPPPVPKSAPPPIPKVPPKSAATALSLSPDAPAPRAPKVNPVPPPVPKVAPKPPADPNDPPLFEGDVDEILGHKAAPAEDERPKPPPTSGQDAMSLGDQPRLLVISSQNATLLMGGVVVLLALAFAAGYFLAR